MISNRIVFFLSFFISVIFAMDFISTPSTSSPVTIDGVLNDVFDFLNGREICQKPLKTVRELVGQQWPGLHRLVIDRCRPVIRGVETANTAITVTCMFIDTYLAADPNQRALATLEAKHAGNVEFEHGIPLVSVAYLLTIVKEESMYGFYGTLEKMSALISKHSANCDQACRTIRLNPEQRPVEWVLACQVLFKYWSVIIR